MVGNRVSRKRKAAPLGDVNLSYQRPRLEQNSLVETRFIDVYPIQTPQRNQPIIFERNGDHFWFTNVNGSHVTIGVRIENKDGSDLLADAPVGLVNYAAHALFRRVTTEIDHVAVSSADDLYPYIAFMSNVMNNTKGRNSSELEKWAGWHKDYPIEEYNSSNPDKNIGLKERSAKHALSKEATYRFLPQDGFWQSEKELPPNRHIKVKFDLQNDAFCLLEHIGDGQASAEYRIRITKAVLTLSQFRPTPEKYQIINELEARPEGLIIDVAQTLVRPITISPRITNHYFQQIYSGQLPTTIGFGLVDQAAFNGTTTSNPFYFHNYDLEQVVLLINNNIWIAKPYKVDFAKKDYQGPVSNFYQQLHHLGSDDPLDVTEEEWANTHNIWLYDIVPGAGTDYVYPQKGTIGLNLIFKTAPTTPLVLVAIGHNAASISLHKDGTVHYTRVIS